MPKYNAPTVELTVAEWDAIQSRLEQADRDAEFVRWFWNEYWPNRVDPSLMVTQTLLGLAAEGRLT